MPTFGFREPEINGLCAFWPRVAEVGLAVGQPVRILTFLPGVQTDALPGGTGHGPPLVMGGFLSGIGVGGPSAEARFWIQSSPIPGVEGAPVIYQAREAQNLEGCGWRLAGIVIGQVHSRMLIREQSVGRSSAAFTLRIGLLDVVPINNVLSVINQALSAPQPRSDPGAPDDGVEIRETPANSTTPDPIHAVRT